MNVLRDVRHLVPARLSALLEFESSVNDPTAILFLGLVIGIATISNLGVEAGATVMRELQIFVQSIGSGLICGLILGYISRYFLNSLVHEESQLLVLGLAVAMCTYGVSSQLGGSGFIAVYITGLFLGNNSYSNRNIAVNGLETALLPFNTMTEIIVFFCFGLIMSPSRVLSSIPSGLVIAIFLMLVARPVSVFLFQGLSPFRLRDTLFVSWCGLRGAVPLALTYDAVTMIPKLPGVDPVNIRPLVDSTTGIIFCVVLISLLVQGFSLQYVCRWLKLDADANPEDPELA
jgi:cell volume regulation protein A